MLIIIFVLTCDFTVVNYWYPRDISGVIILTLNIFFAKLKPKEMINYG